MKHLCENCTMCKRGDYEDESSQLGFATCLVKPSNELERKYVSGKIEKTYPYCSHVRTADTCPDFVALSHSTEAIDEHRRFDDERSIEDLAESEVEDGS